MKRAVSDPARQPDSQPRNFYASILSELTTIGVSTLRDTLTSRNHSKDFTYARAEYLRGRIWIIGLIFLFLMPLWVVIDLIQFPPSVREIILPGRAVMAIGLIAILVLTRRHNNSVTLARLASGVLIGLPAAFYALVLVALPDGSNHNLIGYSFIPYMLTAMLSIFPFTILESAIAGLAMLLLQLLSQHVTGTWWTAAGLQEAWLLAALLVLALTANYFHLGLLQRLYREATHDPLTGLLNRGALVRAIEHLLTMRPRPVISLLMIDIDHFKRINDRHGHSIGDVVLHQFSRLLRQDVRVEDFVARYGGEEFVVLLLNADKDAAMRRAESIRRQAETLVIKDHDNAPVQFTVSIGVTTFRPADTLESAARRADERLYQAKQTSRNCVIG
ncbi:MAG TPA: GGDEF domain-containing protein [Burkholderiaceae bacterium]|nr:GGDEF domain-containing protein [Burkholderiaceae bacterium]